MSNRNRSQLVREDQETVVIGTKTWDALWDSVALPTKIRESEAIADGWLGVAQIAEKWKVKRWTAAERLRQGRVAGKFESITAILNSGRSGLLYRPRR